MLSVHPDPWTWLAKADDASLPLLDAALLIAKDEYPELDTSAYLAIVDSLSEQLRAKSDATTDLEKLHALNTFMFEEQRFAGNFLEYYDSRNSYVSDVLERKLGIPISLAIIYMELGRALGLDLQGVSFPGHFLVRLPVEGGVIVLDAFNRGRSVSAEDLKFRMRESEHAEPASDADLHRLLAPCTKRSILMRMLHNLKALYTQQQDLERALRIANRLVQLSAAAPAELRDRGLLYLDIGAKHAARQDLNEYLKRDPEADDYLEIRQALLEAQSAARLN
jgi:regulator of sirC expression with transglutaminase-like and TPR domain